MEKCIYAFGESGQDAMRVPDQFLYFKKMETKRVYVHGKP